MSGWLLLSLRQIVPGIFRSLIGQWIANAVARIGAVGRITIYTIPNEGVGGEFKIASPKCLELA